MRSFTEGTGFELGHVVKSFPWGELKGGSVIDVWPKQIAVVQAVETLPADS